MANYVKILEEIVQYGAVIQEIEATRQQAKDLKPGDTTQVPVVKFKDGAGHHYQLGPIPLQRLD